MSDYNTLVKKLSRRLESAYSKQCKKLGHEETKLPHARAVARFLLKIFREETSVELSVSKFDTGSIHDIFESVQLRVEESKKFKGFREKGSKTDSQLFPIEKLEDLTPSGLKKILQVLGYVKETDKDLASNKFSKAAALWEAGEQLASFLPDVHLNLTLKHANLTIKTAKQLEKTNKQTEENTEDISQLKAQVAGMQSKFDKILAWCESDPVTPEKLELKKILTDK